MLLDHEVDFLSCSEPDLVVFSLRALSRYASAYFRTRDALICPAGGQPRQIYHSNNVTNIQRHCSSGEVQEGQLPPKYLPAGKASSCQKIVVQKCKIWGQKHPM